MQLVITRFKEVLPAIIEMAIKATNMGSKVAGNHVFFGLAQIPQEKGAKPTVATTAILPPTGATNFLAPYAQRNADEEPRSLRRVKDKCKKLCWYFVRLGHTSAFQDRIETRGMPEGEWGGAFVVGDGTVIVGLSGLTEKLCEAVLLVACVELGLLTSEEALLFSRPRPQGGVPEGHGRRYYDQFYSTLAVAWENLKNEEVLAMLELQQQG